MVALRFVQQLLLLDNLGIQTSWPVPVLCIVAGPLVVPGALRLTQAMPSQLGFASRCSELLMLHLAVQKFVNDVHDILKTCDLANFLEAILCRLALLRLLKDNLLQAVPCKLFDRIYFSESASHGKEGFVCSFHGHLVAPPLEVFAPPHFVAPLLQRRFKVVQGSAANHALLLDIQLHRFKLVDGHDLFVVHAATELLALLHLAALPVQVVLHDLDFLLYDFLLTL
mmetsp:Transcript_74559/g.129307  ORF Transcript_74559/g.129307 Transcript_74559/m.129307 type:complete len:226 (-) Transcript_74559:470-1147(-)